MMRTLRDGTLIYYDCYDPRW